MAQARRGHKGMGLLSDIQEAAAAQLAAQTFFAGVGDMPPVPVLAENKGDISAMARDAMQKLGALALVSIGQAPVAFPDIPGARKEQLELIVTAAETPALNRTSGGGYRTALEIAEQAEQALHLVLLPVDGTSAIVSKGIFPADGAAGVLAYEVRLQLNAGGGEPEGRVIPQVTWPDDPPPTQPGTEYGRLANGRLEVRSLTTGLWHPIYVTGPAGGERLAIGQGVAQ